MPSVAAIWQHFFMIHKKRANRFCFVGWLSFSLCFLLLSRQCRAMSATAFPPHQQPQVRGGRRLTRPPAASRSAEKENRNSFFKWRLIFLARRGTIQVREKKSSSGKMCRNWHKAIENTMNKCLYCGKKTGGNITYCSDECEAKYEKSVRREEGKARLFAVGIAAGVFLVLAGVFVAWTP